MHLKAEVAKVVTATPSGAAVTVALTGGNLTVDGTAYKATVTKAACCSSENRHTGRSLRGEDSALLLPWPGFNPCSGN